MKDLPVVEITEAEILLLFARAVDREDLDHADELAAVLLAGNDEHPADADA